MCGNTGTKTRSVVSLHRLPRKEPKRGRWLEALDLVEDLKDFHRVCSRHFLDGDATKDPQLNLGKRFASPEAMDLEGQTSSEKECLALSTRLSVYFVDPQLCRV